MDKKDLWVNDFASDILTKEFLRKYTNKKVNWGFNGLGYIVYKRTYSRIKENGQSEEWKETIARCINGSQKIGAQYTKEEAERLYDHIFHLRCNFSGRALWQLGTPLVDRFCGNSLINCFYTNISEPEDFCFLMENLMLGGGVGYSIRREHVHELPKIKIGVKIYHENTKDADFICPDSRGGWIELLRKVLNSYFVTGKGFTYSTLLVRGYGEIIKSFGGVASGPKILIDGLDKIFNIFESRQGKKLRSIDALDICNIIGSIIVAGNIRRSAQLALGDADDYLFLRAKRWDVGNIPNWRSLSNNTISADDFDYISDSVWEGYAGTGEPYGFFNLKLSQEYGRLGEKRDDSEVQGLNPCGEITLENGGVCNLSELYLNNISNQEELNDCAKLLYKTQKAICSLNYLHEKTNKIVHKHFRIGIGVTGVCQSLDKVDWLDECYKEVRKFDKIWSKERGWPESIKISTLKPSGSLSILAGSSPGIHPGYSKYFIRRIRMGSNDLLVNYCKGLGLKYEYVRNFDGSEDHNTVIIEFICEFSDNTIVVKDMTVIQQLELVKKLQAVWSDNAISCTAYYKNEDLPQIKEWLNKNYKNSIKSISFLLHSEHGFKQAPYEEITKQQYNNLIKNIKPIENIDLQGGALENLECSGGSCPIK